MKSNVRKMFNGDARKVSDEVRFLKFERERRLKDLRSILMPMSPFFAVRFWSVTERKKTLNFNNRLARSDKTINNDFLRIARGYFSKLLCQSFQGITWIIGVSNSNKNQL